jgi:hypothetical protein
MSMTTKRDVSELKKRAINEAWGGQCLMTGDMLTKLGMKIHIDHIIPLALDGTNDFGNLVPLSATLNLRKSDKKYPDRLQMLCLFHAAERRPTVEKIYAKLTHKPTPMPSMKRVKESQRPQIIDNLVSTTRWDLEKTKTLVNGWLTSGVEFIKFHAREMNKTYRQCVMKLTNLCLYDKEFEGIKTA